MFLKKSLHVLEDGASGEQVGDIEQVIFYFYFFNFFLVR